MIIDISYFCLRKILELAPKNILKPYIYKMILFTKNKNLKFINLLKRYDVHKNIFFQEKNIILSLILP